MPSGIVLLKNQDNASIGLRIVKLQSGFDDACEMRTKRDGAEKSPEGIRDRKCTKPMYLSDRDGDYKPP